MAKLIKNWEELNGLVSTDGKYKVEVNLKLCSGWIKPVNPDQDKDSWKHEAYLSTHTFYGSAYKAYTELLQKYGFDVELDNWDK